MSEYAYHWTSREKAKSIRAHGLRKGSYVCRSKNDWSGEICFRVMFDERIPWDEEGTFSWQLLLAEHVEPSRLVEQTR